MEKRRYDITDSLRIIFTAASQDTSTGACKLQAYAKEGEAQCLPHSL